ncbi:MAG: GNAT family N-acetyltransferase [Bacteroidota bacterium]
MERIERVRREHLETVYQLLRSCATALLERGIEQWSDNYPHRDQVLADWRAQSLWGLWRGDALLGTITLDEEQEAQYANIQWQWTDQRVLVIHRLAVRPHVQGQGLGHRLAAWAEAYARREAYGVIRLDAYSGNPHSQRLYKSRNYRRAPGACWFDGRALPFWCWEKLIV